MNSDSIHEATRTYTFSLGTERCVVDGWGRELLRDTAAVIGDDARVRSAMFAMALLCGCHWFDDGRPQDDSFSERVIGTTRAGTIVVVTRMAYSFPDAALEYHLFLGDDQIAQGALDLDEFADVVSVDAKATTYTFDLRTQRCVVDDRGARCERVFD